MLHVLIYVLASVFFVKLSIIMMQAFLKNCSKMVNFEGFHVSYYIAGRIKVITSE